MKSIKFLIILSLFFSFYYSQYQSNAQDNSSTISSSDFTPRPIFYIGGSVGYNFNRLNTDFSEIPKVEFSQFSNRGGSGEGFSYAVIFKKYFGDQFLLDIQLGLIDHNAKIFEKQDIGPQDVREISNPEVVKRIPVKVEKSLESVVISAGLEVSFGYSFIDNLYLSIGGRTGYAFASRFNLTERITEPSDVMFLNNETYRFNFTNVNITDKNTLLFQGLLKANYDIEIIPSFKITPTLKYYFPFNSSSRSLGWHTSSLVAGIELLLPIMPKKPELKDTLYIRDTTRIEIVGLSNEKIYLSNTHSKLALEERKDANVLWTVIYETYTKEIPKKVNLESSIELIGIQQDGKREKNPTIIIEEIEYVKETIPLLPYIFFKEGDANLNNTNLHLLKFEETKSFYDDSLKPRPLIAYIELLNIVGFRMRKYPDAVLTVVGCNNNLRSEKDNLELSKMRAETVKKYLVEVWQIDEKRINTVARMLPQHPANNSHRDGQEENQRAELYSDHQLLLSHIFIRSTTKRTKIPKVEIYPKILAEGGIKDWNLSLVQAGNPLRIYNGNEKIQPVINWNILEEPIPELEERVYATLTATDKINQSTKAETSCQILQKHIKLSGDDISGGWLVEKFYVIAHFGSSDIIANQRSFIEHVKSRIKPNSKVTIAGYADRTGTQEINRELARRRVNQVQEILQVKAENLKKLPIGSDELLYDNDLPEGRCYSRTILIKIETYKE